MIEAKLKNKITNEETLSPQEVFDLIYYELANDRELIEDTPEKQTFYGIYLIDNCFYRITYFVTKEDGDMSIEEQKPVKVKPISKWEVIS